MKPTMDPRASRYTKDGMSSSCSGLSKNTRWRYVSWPGRGLFPLCVNVDEKSSATRGMSSWRKARIASIKRASALRAARRAEARLMEAIRAFRHEDIPRVAELFSSTFTHNGNSPLPGHDTYLQRVFFESPLHEEDMPSFVYLDARGSIVGFIGVQ